MEAKPGKSEPRWGVRDVKPTENTNKTMCNAFDFHCDQIGTRLLRMTDKFGTPGWRCKEHGDYPCSVEGCKEPGVWKFSDQIRCLEHGELCKAPGCTRRTACTITEPDQYGPPGRRCMTHIAAPCSVPGCHSMARSNVKPADDLGPAGRRCPKHVPTFQKRGQVKAIKHPSPLVLCAARGCQTVMARSLTDVEPGTPVQRLRCEKHRIRNACEIPGCPNPGYGTRHHPDTMRCRKHKKVNIESCPTTCAKTKSARVRARAAAVKKEPGLEADITNNQADEQPSVASSAPVSAHNDEGLSAPRAETSSAPVLVNSEVSADPQVVAEKQMLRERTCELDRLTVLLRRQIEILCARNTAAQANNQTERHAPVVTPATMTAPIKSTLPMKRRRTSNTANEFSAGVRKRVRRTTTTPIANVPAAPNNAKERRAKPRRCRRSTMTIPIALVHAATTACIGPSIPRCAAEHCPNREYIKVSTEDLFGPPGSRCKLHAGPAICAVDDCADLAVTHASSTNVASSFGPLQQFCPLHGGGPRCSVISCDAPGLLTVHQADHIGHPGKRCQAHAAHVHCALSNCPNPYVARVCRSDKFGPPGNRCEQHGGLTGECSVVNCEFRATGSVREHDEVGMPGNRCHRHNKGKGHSCNIAGCKSFARCKVPDPDVFGPPGRRCARHGGHLCCTVEFCENAAAVEGEYAWQCQMHAVRSFNAKKRVPPRVDAKADNCGAPKATFVEKKGDKTDDNGAPEPTSVVKKE